MLTQPCCFANFVMLALLAASAPAPAARADYSTIEVESVATEVLGTPVAIHRVYARIANPALRVQLVSEFNIVVGSALFYHRDFDTGGALSTALGTWNPYQCSTLMSAGDSYVIGGGNAGAAAAGSILFSNWSNLEFGTAQPTFHGESTPGVAWATLNPAQSYPDASGRVHLAQFVTRREDAFTARLKLWMYGPVYVAEVHAVEVSLGPTADDCPDDPAKILPGQCGCGSSDTDSDGDGAANCLDRELALEQRIDCTQPELFVGYGTGAEIRADGDYAIVGGLTSYAAYGTAAMLRRTTDANGVVRWIAEDRIDGVATTAQPIGRARIAVSGERAAVRVARNSAPYAAVRVCERASDGTWPLVREFLPEPGSIGAITGFGSGIALRGDLLAISSVKQVSISPTLYQGIAELYRRDAKGWAPIASVQRDGEDPFGVQVALGDGVLVVGDGRTLFVYRQQKSGAFELVQQLTSPDGFSVPGFGESLALDGDVMVAGSGMMYSGSPHRIGGVVVYRRGADGLYAPEAVLRPEERVLPFAFSVASTDFGASVSVEGDVIAVGGDKTDRAYVFRRGADGAWRCAHVLARDLVASRSFGDGLALAGGQLIVGASDRGSSGAAARPRIDVFDLDPARFGDLDRNGAIGPSDLAILLAAWGTAGAREDLDGDGTVGPRDLVLVLGSWSSP